MNVHFLSRVGLALWALGSLNVSWAQSKTSADADPVEALVEAINVRHLGPGTMSGRVTSIAVPQDSPEVVYVGTASGGLWKSTSADAKDFITKLLTYDPSKRPSAAEALQHKWILNNAKVTTDAK